MPDPLVKIVVMSHKRWDTISTHRVLAVDCVCVPKSQAPLYREKLGDNVEVVERPDEVRGIWSTRNWIMRHFGGVFMVDDDVQHMVRLWNCEKNLRSSTLSPAEARNVILSSAQTCKELGGYLFGYLQVTSFFASPQLRPFSFVGTIRGGGMGLLAGSRLYLPEGYTYPAEDAWLCLLNAFHHRYCWIDKRFALTFAKSGANPGGVMEYRGLGEAETEGAKLLRETFGDAVELDVGPGKAPDAKACGRHARRFTKFVKWRLRIPWGA